MDPAWIGSRQGSSSKVYKIRLNLRSGRQKGLENEIAPVHWLVNSLSIYKYLCCKWLVGMKIKSEASNTQIP